MYKIREYKGLQSVYKALDLDISNWTKINNLRMYLMKDTYNSKSLFTKISQAFENEDYADASRLYLELEDKMSELRSLYSIYEKNLLDI